MKTADKAIILVSVSIILGVLAFLGVYFYKPGITTDRSSLSTPKPALSVPANQVISGTPSSLSVPRLSKTFNVIPGVENYKTGEWTLTWNKVQYATITPKPNNRGGNTLIYGHETAAIFAYLYLLRPGDTVSLTTKNGYIFHYVYQGTYAVNPRDTSLFNYEGAPILTLQTCSGAFFQNRQMYQFSLAGFNKA
jgi:hypothetical protein